MYQKTFLSSLTYLYAMLEFIRDFGLLHNISDQIMDKVILATEEAIVNVINYSYPREEGEIVISCEFLVNPPGIKINIKDQGIPFDPISSVPQRKIHAPPKNLDQLNPGGYGIFIFVGIMDKVEYKRSEEGNTLSLIKFI